MIKSKLPFELLHIKRKRITISECGYALQSYVSKYNGLDLVGFFYKPNTILFDNLEIEKMYNYLYEQEIEF